MKSILNFSIKITELKLRKKITSYKHLELVYKKRYKVKINYKLVRE